MSLELRAEKGCAGGRSIAVPQVRVRSLDANLGLGTFALAKRLPSFARTGRRERLPLRCCVGPEDL